MDIYYKNSTDSKLFNSKEKLRKKYGDKIAAKIAQRLTELHAVDNLSQISNLPPARLHELDHNRKNSYSVDLDEKLRLVFNPFEEPLPLKKDGGIDKEKITKIKIIEVVNYHGK